MVETIDTPLRPADIRTDLQRRQAQRVQVAAAHQAFALAALEGDIAAIDGRAHLAAQLQELDAEISALEHALPIALGREREADRRTLADRTLAAREIFGRVEQALDDTLAAMERMPGVPAIAEMQALDDLGREWNSQRAALASLTEDPRFTRPRDALDELRFTWFEEGRQRERVFDRVRMVRKSLPPSAGRTELDQLLALKRRLEEGN